MIPQSYPLWCAQALTRDASVGRVVGWTADAPAFEATDNPRGGGSRDAVPVIAWVGPDRSTRAVSTADLHPSYPIFLDEDRESAVQAARNWFRDNNERTTTPPTEQL